MEGEETVCLRFGTYNIRNVTDFYEKRVPLLQETFKKMKVDACGFQEVSFDPPELNDFIDVEMYYQYDAHLQIRYAQFKKSLDDKFNLDGNAIIVRKSLLSAANEVSHNILHLNPLRLAHMVSFSLNSSIKIRFVNLHLHHVIADEHIRVEQMEYVLRWIELNSNDDDIVVLVGDFNALPYKETYNMIIENGYESCYSKINEGMEPEKTFHNKMEAPFKDNDPDGTFDYIFIRKNKKHSFKIQCVEIFGIEESEKDKGIFPSDHYAIVAQVEILEVQNN